MAGALQLAQGTAPATPSAGNHQLYVDSADGLLKIKKPDGSSGILADIGRQDNLLLNAEFQYLRRQVPGTLTTYSSTTALLYGPDRWGGVNENASVQYAQTDTVAAIETGLTARFYLTWKKISAQGKMVLAQPLESSHVMPLRGRQVRFSFRAKNGTGLHTLRLGLLQLTSGGTTDVLPATFATAFGAASTDPTWGTNLSAITPDACSTNASIVTSAVTCVLSSTRQQFSGVFTVPTGCRNVVPVIFTDNRPAINDVILVSECMLNEGADERVYIARQPGLEMPLLERYYQKSFDLLVTPVQNTLTGRETWVSNLAAGSITSPRIRFTVPPRTYSNLSAGSRTTLFNPAGANSQVRNERTATDCTASAVTSFGENGFLITATLPATSAIGDLLSVNWAINLEITEQA